MNCHVNRNVARKNLTRAIWRSICGRVRFRIRVHAAMSVKFAHARAGRRQRDHGSHSARTPASDCNVTECGYALLKGIGSKRHRLVRYVRRARTVFRIRNMEIRNGKYADECHECYHGNSARRFACLARRTIRHRDVRVHVCRVFVRKTRVGVLQMSNVFVCERRIEMPCVPVNTPGSTHIALQQIATPLL